MSDEKICILCGRSAKAKTIRHRNSEYTDSVQFHSQCIKEKVERDGSPKDALRMLNIPYVDSLWNRIAEDGDHFEVITRYIKSIAPKSQYRTFFDSEFDPQDDIIDFTVTDEMIIRWGAGLPKEDYLSAESKYAELASLKPPKTKYEEKRYVTNIKISNQLDYALDSGDTRSIKDLQKTYIDDLKNLGLDMSDINERNATKSFGQRIEEWELNAPTPSIGKEFLDVDGIKDYIYKAFTIPSQRNIIKLSDEEVQLQNDLLDSEVPGIDDGDEYE